MLPEHLGKVLKRQEEDEHIECPEVNDYDLELIGGDIVIGYKRNGETLIATSINGRI